MKSENDLKCVILSKESSELEITVKQLNQVLNELKLKQTDLECRQKIQKE